ncbi:MAG: DUF5688 family protein [Clostridiales bacterium]|nr:DUF5688 family protein [Clostridiales bacterium]
MDYEKFVEEFCHALQDELQPEQVSLHRSQMNCVNEEKDALSVRFGQDNLGPIVYLDDMYALHRDGYPVDGIARRMAGSLKEARESVPEMPELSRESAGRSLYCAVVNADDNEALLKEVPHEKLEDLAVIAKFRVNEDATFVVRNGLCPYLKMTPEEVMQQARANTEKTGFTCRDMSAVMRDMFGTGIPGGMEDALQNDRAEQIMYILSNESYQEGAAAITSQKALDQAYLQLGEDFYILPSSRHEVILVPESKVSDADFLKSMVQEVNSTVVSREDRLSDNVYHYDGLTKQFGRADSLTRPEERTDIQELIKEHGRRH